MDSGWTQVGLGLLGMLVIAGSTIMTIRTRIEVMAVEVRHLKDRFDTLYDELCGPKGAIQDLKNRVTVLEQRDG